MKYQIIPSSVGLSSIILVFILVVAFIYLSKAAFDDEISVLGHTITLPHKNLEQGSIPYADLVFQYDLSQRDKIQINNYELAQTPGEGKVTNNEIKALLDCYYDSECQNAKVSSHVNDIVKDYKHFLIKDDMVVLYGLRVGDNQNIIDGHTVIIREDVLADIVNPIYVQTNDAYNTGALSSEDIKDIINAEQDENIISDLAKLKRVAQTIELKQREEQ
jgi:hypothetical protein